VDTLCNLAEDIATALWRRYYQSQIPNWKPATTLYELLTQIDTMVAGLSLAKVDWIASSIPDCVASHHRCSCYRQLDRDFGKK